MSSSKVSAAGPRCRLWLADAWRVFLRDFARRLTSHRAGICTRPTINLVDFGTPPRPHCSQELRHASVALRRRLTHETRLQSPHHGLRGCKNRLAAHRPTHAPRSAAERKATPQSLPRESSAAAASMQRRATRAKRYERHAADEHGRGRRAHAPSQQTK